MTSEEEQPEFGPAGYLPRRAAQRARKIVLREQMGLGWVLAAVAAGIVLVGVGVALLLTRPSAPGPTFAAVAPLTAIDPAGSEVVRADGAAVLVVRAGGGVRAFAAPDADVRYCAASRRLEATGRVWNLRGRLVGGDGASLRPLTTRVHEGVVYVDPTGGAAPPPTAGGDERPACLP